MKMKYAIQSFFRLLFFLALFLFCFCCLIIKSLWFDIDYTFTKYYNRRIFIVAWITYIYVWQRFERYFTHHRAKWIDLFPVYIVLTRKKLALFAFGYTVFTILTPACKYCQTYLNTRNYIFIFISINKNTDLQ